MAKAKYFLTLFLELYLRLIGLLVCIYIYMSSAEIEAV